MSISIPSRPKRPLSAYNLFFAFERKRILEERSSAGNAPDGKVGYSNLTKEVAHRWNNINASTKLHFDELASKEKMKFKKAIASWKKLKRQAKNQKMRNRMNQRGGGGGGSTPTVVSMDLAHPNNGVEVPILYSNSTSFCSLFASNEGETLEQVQSYNQESSHIGNGIMNPAPFQQAGGFSHQQEVATNLPCLPYSEGIDILAESLGTESIDWMIQAFSTSS